MSKWSVAIRWSVIILAAMLFFITCLADPAPLELLFHLIVGWVMYVIYVLPRVRVNWTTLASTSICLIAFAGGAHAFAGWIYRHTKSSCSLAATWRARWTAAGVGIVFLMFIAGTAAVAVAHQFVFLATSEKPIWTTSPGLEKANRIKCASNMRQIGQAIVLYAQENDGRNPDSLEQLFIAEEDLTQEVFLCPSDPYAWKVDSSQRSLPNHLSYVYVGRGVKSSASTPIPVLFDEAVSHHSEGANVLFSDGTVEFCQRERVSQLWKEANARSASP